MSEEKDMDNLSGDEYVKAVFKDAGIHYDPAPEHFTANREVETLNKTILNKHICDDDETFYWRYSLGIEGDPLYQPDVKYKKKNPKRQNLKARMDTTTTVFYFDACMPTRISIDKRETETHECKTVDGDSSRLVKEKMQKEQEIVEVKFMGKGESMPVEYLQEIDDLFNQYITEPEDEQPELGFFNEADDTKCFDIVKQDDVANTTQLFRIDEPLEIIDLEVYEEVNSPHDAAPMADNIKVECRLVLEAVIDNIVEIESKTEAIVSKPTSIEMKPAVSDIEDDVNQTIENLVDQVVAQNYPPQQSHSLLSGCPPKKKMGKMQKFKKLMLRFFCCGAKVDC